MNTEEVLIFLLALAAALSLFVGLAQALDGRPRRLPTRRAHAASPHHRRHLADGRSAEPRGRGSRIFSEPPAAPASGRTDRALALPAPPVAVAFESAAVAVAPPPVQPQQTSLLDPDPEEAAALRPERDATAVEEVPAVVAASAPPAPTAPEPPAPPEVEPAPAPVAAAVAASDLVAESARLLKAGSHEALLAAVNPVLKPRGRGRARPAASYERALLWGMAGLASKARGDEPATRAAFEQGIRSLPKSDLKAEEARLAPVAESVGGQLLAGGVAAGDGSASTLAGLRLSVGLLRAVATVPPGQPAAEAGVAPGEELSGAGGDDLPPWGRALRAHLAVERARDALATAAERRLGGFLDKRDHAGGFRWLRDAMGWEELGDRRGGVEDAYWGSVGGEVARLTARALDSGDDMGAAMAALQSAEAFVQTLPEAAGQSPRMDEIRRRLWWGHTRLGVERIEAGDVTGALEPLYHALRLAGGDPDRESESRHALAQALEAQAAGAWERVEGLLEAGDRAAAEAAGEELCRAIDRGLAEGISQEELAGALTRRQHVMTRIAQADEQ